MKCIFARRSGVFGFVILAFCACGAAAESDVHLIVPRIYRPQTPVLVRVEARLSSGARDLNLWDADASLSIDNPGISLSTNRIRLRNGLGTALVSFTGGGDFTLRAALGSKEDSKSLRDISGSPSNSYGGTLGGASTTWRGVVFVTNDVTVPAGHTLTIESNTLVLITGVASGTAAADLLVSGNVQALGTDEHPIQITCATRNLNWGQIRHASSQPSLYRHTIITKGGRAAGEGHTMTGSVFKVTNSRLTFQSSTISDATASGATIGKIMQADGSDLTFDNSVMARCRMGPEVNGTAVLCTNTWITEMTGPDDADGIYLHDAPGRRLLMTGCVIASGNDDAIDLLNAVVDIDNCIVRDWPNPSEDAKGISAFHGVTRLRRCLFVNCYVGVAAKSSGPNALVTLTECTVTGILRGLSALWKNNATVGNIDFRVTNCIVRSPDAIHSDFAATNFPSITYCNLSEDWAGAGNTTDDPGFVNTAANDYHLQPGSPCVDSAHPATPPDPDGSPADRGFYRFQPPSPALGNLERRTDGAIEFSIAAYTNRNYVVEFSSDFSSWSDLLTSWQGSDSMTVEDSPPPDTARRYYRARLAP